MKRVVNIFKPVCYTPLEVIEAFCQKNPEYRGEKIGYAGRLDPMASGVLLLLVGDENLKRKIYEKLPKEYEFEVLLGVSSDTYDVMGEIQEVKEAQVVLEEVEMCASKYMGVWEQEYPPYSSARVSGKPLYWWARQVRLGEISIPKKSVEVFSLEVLELRTLPLREVKNNVMLRIGKTKGDFRQEKIISQWKNLTEKQKDSFQVVKFRISSSSGVYVRGIADQLGRDLFVPALAYSILRTRVGEYGLSEAISLDSIR